MSNSKRPHAPRKYYPNKSAIFILRAIAFLLSVLLIVALRLTLSAVPLAVMILSLIITLLWVVIAVIWLPFFFAKLLFVIGTTKLSLNQGVLFQQFQVMDKSAVQYVTIITTPFSKKTAINVILIHALGGIIIVPFLKYDDCREILNILGKNK